jgi:hypothetical protein
MHLLAFQYTHNGIIGTLLSVKRTIPKELKASKKTRYESNADEKISPSKTPQESLA